MTKEIEEYKEKEDKKREESLSQELQKLQTQQESIKTSAEKERLERERVSALQQKLEYERILAAEQEKFQKERSVNALIGDVGGTNIRLAVLRLDMKTRTSTVIKPITKISSQGVDSLNVAILDFLKVTILFLNNCM